MNSIQLIGNIIKDPELRFSQSGKAITKFTIAVNRNMKNAEGKYDSDFINCISFGPQGEMIANHFRKGDEIALSGRIQAGSYEKDGIKRYTFDVIVNDVTFTRGKKKHDQDVSKNDPFANAGKAIDLDDESLPF